MVAAIEGAPLAIHGAVNCTPRPALHAGSDIPGVAVKLAGSSAPVAEDVVEYDIAAA
jgi:hypothetical protein